MLRLPRGPITTLVAVALTAGIVGAAPTIAELGRRATGPAPAAVNNETWIKSGWNNGPVALPGDWGTIASLPLPAGSYSVVAKLWLVNNDPGARLSDCKLILGSSWDYVEEETEAHGVMVLTVVGILPAKGQAVLQCMDQAAGHVDAHWIKITATKASKLINVNLP